MADKAAKAGLVALGAGLAFLAKHFIDESATEPTQPTVVKEKKVKLMKSIQNLLKRRRRRR
jgi:hypothetical protein